VDAPSPLPSPKLPDEPLAEAPMGVVVPPRRDLPRLSPINRRRWENFKANKRGYWSLWIFLVLFFLTLFAELIANNKPILVSYDGHWYAPIFRYYPETTFGGEFETEADYRDPYLVNKIAEKGGWMLFPPIRYSYSTSNLDLPTPAPSPPTWMLTEAQCKDVATRKGVSGCAGLEQNWLGTDDQGRDVLARIIYGFRISVLFGLVLTIVSSVIGVAAGAVQGYFGGWTDLLFQRFIEIWTSIPSLYLLLIISSVLAPGFFVLLGILLLFSWVALVGLVRAEFLRARNFEYVQAARALGVSNFVLMWRHLLPNAMVATLTYLPFILSSSVMTLTALDFLGFGLPPGSPSLGELLSQAKANVQAPWLGITGFFTLAILLSLLIFIGEAVRDAFDPRKTYQ
jgi:microcin C transport system permease protein